MLWRRFFDYWLVILNRGEIFGTFPPIYWPLMSRRRITLSIPMMKSWERSRCEASGWHALVARYQMMFLT